MPNCPSDNIDHYLAALSDGEVILWRDLFGAWPPTWRRMNPTRRANIEFKRRRWQDARVAANAERAHKASQERVA